jgi:hypothetical protein
MVLDDNLDVRSLANENETFYELKSRNMVRMRIFEIITILTCIVIRIFEICEWYNCCGVFLLLLPLDFEFVVTSFR